MYTANTMTSLWTWVVLLVGHLLMRCRSAPLDAERSAEYRLDDETEIGRSDTLTDLRQWCGVTQVLDRPQQYVLGPNKWNKTQLTFRILNFPANLSYEEVRYGLTNAFSVWSDVTMLSFSEVQIGPADISIEFSTGFHQDGYPFDGPGKVVAHAFYPGYERGGDVHFDADEQWTVHSTEGVNLFTVAAHEIGHALGLSHSAVPGSLMSPWHHGHSVDFVLPDDDVAAIQQLYASRDPPRRRQYKAPTAAPRPPSVGPPTDDVPVVPHNGVTEMTLPDPCTMNLDAISVIRGELFAFKGKWFWRISVNEKGKLLPDMPTQLDHFWFGLPPYIDKIDAVFERPRDGQIFFFSGNHYWEFSGNNVDLEMSSVNGRPLTDLGIPSNVSHVDATFVWGYNQQVYLVSGRSYWRLDDTDSRVQQRGYPRDMATWAGVKLPIDTAFTHTDGRTYFFKDKYFWEFNDVRMQVRHGYPKPLGQRWFGCFYSNTSVVHWYVDDRLYSSASAVARPTLASILWRLCVLMAWLQTLAFNELNELI